jgi:hypothetical protein
MIKRGAIIIGYVTGQARRTDEVPLLATLSVPFALKWTDDYLGDATKYPLQFI